MCGRYALHANPNVVALQFGLADEPAFTGRYNIAPTTDVLVVRSDPDRGRVAGKFRWGLIPSWAKDPAIGAKLNNARAETVAEKPSFRSAFRRWRCLIPANGFYEWKVVAGQKQPYYIRPADDDALFGFAGLTERWEGPAGAVQSCCVITTDPNVLMATIHDRMPVIIARDQYDAWLDPANKDRVGLQAMLKPCPADAMIAYPVSRSVSYARNEGSDLIARVAAPLQEPGPELF